METDGLKGSQFGIILRSPARVASDLQSLHKESCSFARPIDGSRKRAAASGREPWERVWLPRKSNIENGAFSAFSCTASYFIFEGMGSLLLHLFCPKL